MKLLHQLDKSSSPNNQAFRQFSEIFTWHIPMKYFITKFEMKLLHQLDKSKYNLFISIDSLLEYDGNLNKSLVKIKKKKLIYLFIFEYSTSSTFKIGRTNITLEKLKLLPLPPPSPLLLLLPLVLLLLLLSRLRKNSTTITGLIQSRRRLATDALLITPKTCVETFQRCISYFSLFACKSSFVILSFTRIL
uniref:Uncharacterized protein n=1 Tax=Trichogramma kaykai TaxID=54128 RepID=A0ABD2W8K3_9HYME